jgi:hypothetical protein
VTLAGHFHEVRDAGLLPPPDRPIPLLVAANAPHMLRLTARYADAWNTAWYGLPDDRLSRRMSELELALEHEGRDPSTLRRTVGIEVIDANLTTSGDLAASIDGVARAINTYEAVGFDDVIVGLRPQTKRSLDCLAEARRLLGS